MPPVAEAAQGAAMTSAETKPVISIRAATREDLPILRQLLSERDGLERDEASVLAHLIDCDPDRFMAWIATDQDTPVGLTALYLRTIRFDGEEPAERRAGYWAHLYVAESHRSLMVYPQLVFAMTRGMRDAGLELLFTATRQPDVADGHQKLGYQLVGTIPVLFRPLRPFRLVARQKQLGSLAQALSAAPDALWKLWLNFRRTGTGQGTTIQEVPLEDPGLEDLVELMNARAGGRIAQVWTIDSFRARFKLALDGERYVLHIVRDGERVVGGAIHRLAVRGHGVRTGVLLDVILAKGHEEIAPALLGAIERRMMQDGADVVLQLDGIDAKTSELARRRGYRTAPDIYHLLVNPRNLVGPDTWEGTPSNWLFSFSDHDAF